MKYSEFIKQAYNFDDLRHPDNATANTIAGGVAGAGILGGGSYLLAKLLKADKPWAWGLGAAAVGGTSGAITGNALTDKWTNPMGLAATIPYAMQADALARKTPEQQELDEAERDMAFATRPGATAGDRQNALDRFKKALVAQSKAYKAKRSEYLLNNKDVQKIVNDAGYNMTPTGPVVRPGYREKVPFIAGIMGTSSN